MRCVLQRVNSASVSVDGKEVSKISQGLLILLGVGKDDNKNDAEKLADKLIGLRIFSDSEGKFNLGLTDINGKMLVVSQFTLYGNCKKGRRPGFDKAAPPEIAESMYNYFCDYVVRQGIPVERGVFGAMMKVSLENDGPVTIIIDTDDWKK